MVIEARKMLRSKDQLSNGGEAFIIHPVLQCGVVFELSCCLDNGLQQVFSS